MASPLQQAVASVRTNDYIFLVIITAIGYDYILTFTKEMEYIWNKPWTLVSVLFVLDYVMSSPLTLLALLFYLVLQRCELISVISTHTLSRMASKGEIGTSFASWSFCICWCAAELMMVLRVHALYKRSKLIFGTLLTLYVIEMVSIFAYFVVHQIQLGPMGYGTLQVSQLSVCISTDIFGPFWLKYLSISLWISLGSLMCLLTAIQFIKELLEVYEVAKCFKLNSYMKHLARDAVIYFIVILIFALLAAVVDTGPWAQWFTIAQDIPPFTLFPRFVLSLRELYAHDLQGRRGSHIDTAFGFGSEFAHGTIQFADPGDSNDGDEQSDESQTEEIQEVRRTHSLV